MNMIGRAARFLRDFRKEDDGVVTLEFVIIFPVFFGFFLMTVENGIIQLQHTMLERGVDVTVREIRIGRMTEIDRGDLKEAICTAAGIIADCEAQMDIEMIENDLRAWVPINGPVTCVDRGDTPIPDDLAVPTGGNNALMFLRVCVRIDPFMPTTGLGKTIVEANSGSAAAGSHALVSTAAFVIEPFD